MKTLNERITKTTLRSLMMVIVMLALWFFTKKPVFYFGVFIFIGYAFHGLVLMFYINRIYKKGYGEYQELANHLQQKILSYRGVCFNNESPLQQRIVASARLFAYQETLDLLKLLQINE